MNICLLFYRKASHTHYSVLQFLQRCEQRNESKKLVNNVPPTIRLPQVSGFTDRRQGHSSSEEKNKLARTHSPDSAVFLCEILNRVVC